MEQNQTTTEYGRKDVKRTENEFQARAEAAQLDEGVVRELDDGYIVFDKSNTQLAPKEVRQHHMKNIEKRQEASA